MAGHVFVTRSDLTGLRCDAWLLPTDQSLSLTGQWAGRLSRPALDHIAGLRRDPSRLPAGWGDAGIRVTPLGGQGPADRTARPYLVNVGGHSATPVAWYLEGARQFLQAVAARAAAEGIGSGRTKALAALPAVGTGRGGAGAARGALLLALLGTLREEAETLDLDVVLVTNDEPTFIAAQNARRQLLGDPLDAAAAVGWSDLDPDLAAEARRLAGFATAGRLVLFVGAGVSKGAALPDWGELLDDLAADAGMSADDRRALKELHELDRPRIIGRRLAARGGSLGRAVVDRFGSGVGFTLAHSLLASLPVTEVVTTNYDTLFEDAAAAAGRAAAVLPYEPAAGGGRWLLKLHGSVTHPDDIVLTREDYLRYADRRAALAAIVQAMLITRHMLFLGFSLRDDNFHRIVDDVRKAIGGSGASGDAVVPFGSALLLRTDPLLEELWRDDLRLVSLGGEGGGSTGEAARRLDVFLDSLLAESSRGTSPLLDPVYDGVLTDEEREIRDLLRALEAGASKAARGSSAWRPVADLLERLGGPRPVRRSEHEPREPR